FSVLSDMKMVEPAFKKGIRTDLYQTEEDWYKSCTSLFGNRWRQHTETNIEEAEETMEELEARMRQTTDDQLSVKISQDIERLRYAQNYYKWLMKFIRVVETGEIFDYIPKNKDE